jgi:hypothetical protein
MREVGKVELKSLEQDVNQTSFGPINLPIKEEKK